MPTLHVHLPGSGVVTHELAGKGAVKIGWADDNAIQIKDASVSRHHAEIVGEGDALKIRDLGSANKCWLNGVAVLEAPLHDGDMIRFGNIETIFRLGSGGDLSQEIEATVRGCLIMALPGGESAFRFDSPLVTIGWKSDNALRIQDPSISGHHAQLVQLCGKYRLKDLNSTNKTYINGHTIIEAEINNGDKVQFGAVEGVFRVEYGIRPVKTITAPGNPVALALQVKETEGKMQEMETKIVALTKERDGLSFHNVQLSAQLQESAARTEELKNALQEKEKAEALARELREKLEAAAAEAKTLLASLTQERDTLKAANTEAAKLDEALQSAKETGEEATRKLREAQSLIENLSGGQNNAQQKISELSQSCDAAQRENERLAGDLEKSRAGQLSLEQERDAAREKSDTLARQLSEATEKMATLEKERAALNEQLAAAAAASETAAQENKKLSAQWEEARNQAQTLETERAASLQTAQEAQKKAAELQAEIARFQERLDVTQTEITESKKAAQETETQLSTELAAAKAAADSIRTELTQAKTQLTALAAERDALAAERDALQAAAAEASSKPSAAQLHAEAPPRPEAPPPPPSGEMPKLSLIREQPVAPATPTPGASLIEIAKPLRPLRLEKSSTHPLDAARVNALLESAPETLNGMRRCLHTFIKNQTESQQLEELLASLHELTAQAVQASLASVATLSSALEALIDDLMKIPGQINPSSLRTVSQSIDFLAVLLDSKNLSRTKDPFLANIFAVDDEAEARKTIRAALEMVNLKVVCAENPSTTLSQLNEQKFDLIFIDVGLPEMNGFELCTRLRKLADYKKTPVVFITGAVTVQNRVQSSLSGGNDFIAKPFNLLELGVKALIWIFKDQLSLV